MRKSEEKESVRRHNSTVMTRREFLRVAGISAAGAALAACSPGATPTTRRSGPVQLVYRDWRTDWFPPMVQQMLAEFHATHPDIRVFYALDPDSPVFEDKSLADFQAGTAPDVYQGCCSSFPVWAQKGYALDLRKYVAADLDRATIDDWDPVQYRSFFTLDGKQYGLPKYHGALALFYNKDIFDQLAMEYPSDAWSHDDYLAAMKKITSQLKKDGKTDVWGSMLDISWERIQVHVNAWGGHFVDPSDPTRSLMGEAPALEAMEWIRARMWDDRVMASALDVQNLGTREAFVAGKLAMVEDGSWALKDILSSATFRVGVAPFPKGPVRRATLATNDGFGINAATRYPDAAWELLKFLISKEYGRAMARAQFLQPARVSLVDEWIKIIRDEYPAKTKDMDLAAFADGQRKGYSVIAETFLNQADARQLVGTAWQKIFTMGQAPVSDMRDVSVKIGQAQLGFKK